MLSEDDVQLLRAEIQADTAAGRYEAAQAKLRLLSAAGKDPSGTPATGLSAAPAVRKNPGLAAVLSFVVCGLGQIYNGELLRGIVMFVLYVVLFLLFWAIVPNFTIGLLVPIALWIFGIVDAYRMAEQMNRGALL